MKKILQISTDYSGTPLYKGLMEELLKLDFKIEVFIPERRPERVGRYYVDNQSISYFQPICIRSLDKVLYFRKIGRSLASLERETCISDIGIIHAHTLFTDGGIAYKLWQKYRVPYIVTLRNTDINFFLKYAVHLRPWGRSVLRNASKICFISKALRRFFFDRYVAPEDAKAFEEKSITIPNGIHHDWFCDETKSREQCGRPLRIAFVARNLSKNKNLSTVVQVVSKLKGMGVDTELRVVGEGEVPLGECNVPLKHYESISSIDEMKKFYDGADLFLLPSLRETFGLVYVEAMSRGLPVLYTQGQGFDGYFNEGEVGFSISPLDVDDIVEKIVLCMDVYSERSSRCIERARMFQWSDIATSYSELYQDL